MSRSDEDNKSSSSLQEGTKINIKSFKKTGKTTLKNNKEN